jgi:hypothetical protein
VQHLEKQLGRALDVAQQQAVPTLNDVTPQMVAELRALPGPFVNMYLKFHLRPGSEAAFEDFTRDVIRGDADAKTWGYRDVVALVTEQDRGQALTMSADQLRELLAGVEGERWVRYAVGDARRANQLAASGAIGAPGVLVRHVPYWWKPPRKEVVAHLVSGATEAIPDAGLAVALRRWIATRAAWWAKFVAIELASASPQEVAQAIGIGMDRVTADGAIGLAGLIQEAQRPFDPEHHVRGYVGPDVWYAGAGEASAPVGGVEQAALAAHRAWLVRGGNGSGRWVASGVDASGLDLAGGDLSRCVVQGSTFERAAFGGSRLGSACFTGSSFRDAVFGDAVLDDAVFIDCELQDADFSALGARGSAGTTARCRFYRCDLRGALWIDRDLSRAEFVDCRLDMIAGTPRAATDVVVVRPMMKHDPSGPREVSVQDVLSRWNVGEPQPPLDDAARASLHDSLRGRWRKAQAYAARGPRPLATGVGTLADKWKGPFLPVVDDPGEPIALPAGTAAGIVARRGADGVTRCSDARTGLALVLPSPTFLPPSDRMDASVGMGGAILDILDLGPAPAGGAADEIAGIVSNFIGEPPKPIALPGAGIVAAATGTVRRSDVIREVAALAGGGSRARLVLLLFEYPPALDVEATRALWSTVLGSAAFAEARP